MLHEVSAVLEQQGRHEGAKWVQLLSDAISLHSSVGSRAWFSADLPWSGDDEEEACLPDDCYHRRAKHIAAARNPKNSRETRGFRTAGSFAHPEFAKIRNDVTEFQSKHCAIDAVKLFAPAKAPKTIAEEVAQDEDEENEEDKDSLPTWKTHGDESYPFNFKAVQVSIFKVQNCA